MLTPVFVYKVDLAPDSAPAELKDRALRLYDTRHSQGRPHDVAVQKRLRGEVAENVLEIGDALRRVPPEFPEEETDRAGHVLLKRIGWRGRGDVAKGVRR